jgi:hypothetical protein
MYGRRAQCSCGVVVEVPFPQAAAAPSRTAAQSAAAGIQVICPSCAQAHLADYALAGQAVRCPCGGVLTVPLSNAAAAPPTSVFDELSDNEKLRTAAQAAYPYAPGYGQAYPANPGAFPQPPGYPPPYGAAYPHAAGAAPQPAKKSDAELLSPYLENTDWRKPDRYSASEESGPFAFEKSIMNGSIVGGMLAMLVAAVWFVFALNSGGRLYFYPPILFVVGLIGVIRGVMNRF